MIAYALTTLDNPYDPFDDFDNWYAFDESNNYGTCSYLSRIAKTSMSLSDAENQTIINDAVDEILKFNLLGTYKKVVKDVD